MLEGSDSKERHGGVAVIGLGDGSISSNDLGKRKKQEETTPDVEHTPIFPLFLPPAASTSAHLYCPTCVALGACSNAPSLPCPNDTVQCYQGRLQITGGKLDIWWFQRLENQASE